MIDPTNITNYNLSRPELEEHILFWVCAAGKNGVTAAKCLDKFINILKERYGQIYTPFSLIKLSDAERKLNLVRDIKSAGIGNYNLKSITFKTLAESSIDLKTCTVDDLESIMGIGPKTARCFLIHSRPNQRLAGLDVHILRFLSDRGYKVPKSTPVGKKYKEIEQWFIKEADRENKDIATFDLEIWNKYRSK